MKKTQADRLVRRARQSRADGSHGLAARWAWRRLHRAHRAGDRNARGAIQEAWLTAPDDELWDVLSGWWGVPAMAKLAFKEAANPGRDAASRALIGAFCLQRGVVPDNEPERALFYTLTGQAGQRRAADPDGRGLALVYQAADDPVRTALRAAMAEAGDVDLVRVLGARSTGRTGLSVGEASYLSDQLAARRDWSGLWRLAQDLPLLPALEAMRHLRGAWRPPDGQQGSLFDRLATAEPAVIGAARDALADAVVVKIETGDTPVKAAFSPDGKHLAIVTGYRYNYQLLVYDLPGGALAARYRDPGDVPSSPLYTDDAIFAVCSRRLPNAASEDEWEYRLVRFAAGQTTVIEENIDWGAKLGPVPEGFAMWWSGPTVRIRTSRGELVRDVQLDGMSWTRLHALNRAFHRPSGRVAMAVSGEACVYDLASAKVLNTPMPVRNSPVSHRCFFLGPDLVAVIFAEKGDANVYWLDGNALRAVGKAYFPWPYDWGRAAQLGDEIVVLDRDQHLVRFLGGETLGETRWPQPFSTAGPTGLWACDDGQSWAIGGKRGIEVFWGADPAVPALADRPLAGMSAADLTTVSGALLKPAPGAAARPFLELMRDVLAHRFGTEVAIGAPRADLAAEDIALSGEEPRSARP